MKVNILASGSNGNCIALTSGKTTILVDVGIAKTKIEKRLLGVGIRPDQIEVIFITHAHKDHTKGLPLANKYKIPVYAAYEEWKDIKGVDKELQFDLPDDYEGFGEWFKVCPFHVYHDAFDPRGYTVISNDYKVAICLDTGHVDSTMLEAMKNSNVYIIEANHDQNMVEASAYPKSVKARILSDVGHLSNKQTADALSKLIQGKGEKIYLTHLSSNNNMHALAELTVVRKLAQRGLKKDKHYKIEVV